MELGFGVQLTFKDKQYVEELFSKSMSAWQKLLGVKETV